MKVLITGASGLLGKSLIETAPEDAELTATYKKNGHAADPNGVRWYHLDVRERLYVFELVEDIKPDVIIHCAAVGSVDFAEKEGHYDPVFKVNVAGTQHVADAANGFKAKVVYISSNAVFSGNNPPYNEESLLSTVNAYGAIKKNAERVIRDTANNWIIIRPFLLYGWPYSGGRTNWAKSIVDKLSSGGAYHLVNDHVWMPTYAPECADAIWGLLDRDNEIFNVAAPERATLYEFGLKVCEVWEFDQNLIQPAKSDYFPTLAKRPHDTTYDLVKLSKAGIMLSDIRTGLEKMKKAQ